MNAKTPRASTQRRNYGFGRRVDWAGKQALKQRFGGGHFSTVATHSMRWSAFAQWAKESAAIKDMRQIDADLVQRYASHLQQIGHAVATVQNAVSTVNVVLTHASQGQWSKLSPLKLAGAPRSNIRMTVPASLDLQKHQAAVAAMRSNGMHRAAAIADLARNFGVRSEEAVKSNLDRWQQEAKIHSQVNVQEGTKGGRDVDRWIPVTEAGRAALTAARAARPAGSRNLLVSSESYGEAREGWIRQGRQAYADATGGRGYHDARAAYACARYAFLTDHSAPVVTGMRTADRDADLNAREVISVELGHGRPDVLVSYVGSRR